jgi:predicted transcriptional regulator
MNVETNGVTFGGNAGKTHTRGRRRSSVEIIADMLRVGEKGAGKTEIMYSANMSYNQNEKYMDYLITEGFLNKINLGNSVVAYKVSDSGLKLLKTIDTLMGMLNTSSEEEET